MSKMIKLTKKFFKNTCHASCRNDMRNDMPSDRRGGAKGGPRVLHFAQGGKDGEQVWRPCAAGLPLLF